MSSTNETATTETEQSIQPRIGRPSKKELEANTAGHRKKVGRPKGDAAKMNEYKAMMLTSPKSALVLEKILDAALNDEHKNQSAAWKLVIDRMLPVSMFDKAAGNSGGGIKIHVEVVGGDVTVQSSEEPPQDSEEAIEAEYEEVDDENS